MSTNTFLLILVLVIIIAAFARGGSSRPSDDL